MKRIKHALLVVLAALTLSGLVGCSQVKSQVAGLVSGDLSVAIKRGEAVLGSDDALVVCYKALDEVIKAQMAADQLDGGLLLDAVMQARILDQMRKKVGPQLQKACGEITIEVMMQVARRGR